MPVESSSPLAKPLSRAQPRSRGPRAASCSSSAERRFAARSRGRPQAGDEALFWLFFLPIRAGAVVGDGDTGFGEGFHVVEDVEGGVDDLKAEAGDRPAGGGDVEAEEFGLSVEEVGRERGREGLLVGHWPLELLGL